MRLLLRFVRSGRFKHAKPQLIQQSCCVVGRNKACFTLASLAFLLLYKKPDHGAWRGSQHGARPQNRILLFGTTSGLGGGPEA